MKLEQQVTSLELSKRLKELGVRQESHFVWHREGNLASVELSDGKNYPLGVERLAAFTVAELGEMLPKHIKAEDKEYKSAFGFRTTDVGYRPYCEYWHPYEGKRDFRIGKGFTSHTEADARASMLIHLIENKLITL